jgi:tRNA(Ile)-lysidine synthase
MLRPLFIIEQEWLARDSSRIRHRRPVLIDMIEKVHRYIREQRLIAPGERVSVAVSGGADSVALLRILLELRRDLGVVLSVAHFNHRIRGSDADADEQFVKELAGQFELEFHLGSADVPAASHALGMSLETAARELRHAWFATLVREGKTEKIATAHTQDDQAETVLMRMLRGAGTRGLAGISPRQRQKALLRPLLTVTRQEIEAWLMSHNQPWREDASNRDPQHTRNRVRHQLLPLLISQYNPAIKETLADLAELARGEEEYWDQELPGLVARLIRSGEPGRTGRSHGRQSPLAVDAGTLRALPVAIQRRLLRALGDQLGVALEFKHIQQLLLFADAGKSSKALTLPGGLEARRTHRELQLIATPESQPPAEYHYSLPVPGQVEVAELGTTVRARVIWLAGDQGVSLYNSGLLNRNLLAPELTIRNWRPGDRFFPAHSRSPKKVKELLESGRLGRKVSPAQRKRWPVIESGGQIVWMRGFLTPQAFAATSGEAVLIEELRSA